MLNPSTADADDDDHTIRRVVGFTHREGYPAAVVVNLWGLRATDPKDLHARRTAYEPKNIAVVSSWVRGRDVVVAWGANATEGPAMQRVKLALQHARSVRCLGLTKGQACNSGCARVGRQPLHPLRLRSDTPLRPWHLDDEVEIAETRNMIDELLAALCGDAKGGA